MSFNFGAEPTSGGGSLKQAPEGQHEARLLGIVHLGMYADEYPVGSGKFKDAAPFVCALFELKSENGKNEDDSPIIVHKSFPLKRGDRAMLTKFMKAILSAEDFRKYQNNALDGSFDDYIGTPVMIDMKGGKAMNDDGTPKYTNVESVTAMPAKLAKITEELEGTPVGHVPFDAMTEAALRAVPPFEIYGKMEKANNFPGSKAEEVLYEVRKQDPDFAKPSEEEAGKGKPQESAPPEQARDDLDDEKEF